MDKALDMSLDDIIKSKKSVGGRGRGSAPRGRGARGGSIGGGRLRGRGGGSGRGSGRPAFLGVNTRPSTSAIAKTFRRPKTFPWQRDLLEESLAAAGLPGMESGTKLFISNLASGVSNNDIRELFSEIGELKRYAIHFDKSGRPSGSAEVVYAKRNDAFAAHKRYNNVQLDGKPMKIEVVTPNAEAPVSTRINVFGGSNGKPIRRVTLPESRGRRVPSAPTNRGFGQRPGGGLRNGQGPQGRAPNQGRGMGRGRGQRGGRGRGRGKKQDKSAEQLDKELETYHAQGMNVDM
ncbi:THO complex subunit 4C-like isoform X2 [Silene latifolia]|uniref:THO complex subunit 4C-like isoform X2 n=1 Tax=Silene latifolia TaxID=37657 RepID=UPI003D78A7B0